MISTDISLSESFNDCSEFAQTLFLMMIPHCDDWGRLVGNPAKVKAKVKPLSKRTAMHFERALLELAQADLICWYENCAGELYVAFKPESWDDYQAGIHRKAHEEQRRQSRYPAPPNPAYQWPEDASFQQVPGESGKLVEIPPKLNLTKDNLTKLKTPMLAENTGKQARLGKEKPPEGYHECLAVYWESLKAKLNGLNPPKITGGDGKLLKQRLDEQGHEIVQKILEWQFAGGDEKLEECAILKTRLSEHYFARGLWAVSEVVKGKK